MKKTKKQVRRKLTQPIEVKTLERDGFEVRYVLSVREVNNLVRFLYTNGWISHEQHPDVHRMLDEMVKWLEQQGIKVSMDMPRL